MITLGKLSFVPPPLSISPSLSLSPLSLPPPPLSLASLSLSLPLSLSPSPSRSLSPSPQILGLIRRNIVYKEKELLIPLYKTIVRPHLEYCIQAWRPYRKKDIDMLERVQRRATKMIPKLRNISYEIRLKECGLTTLETRRLRGDQNEVFKILNGYENIDRNIFSRSRNREGLEDMELH